jgi:Cu/Ag efflux pump CusA
MLLPKKNVTIAVRNSTIPPIQLAVSIFGTIGTSSTGRWSQLEASMDAVPGGSTVPPQVLTTAASLAAAALEGAHVTPALLKETTKGHKGVEKMGDT